jgi:hypothetical protein
VEILIANPAGLWAAAALPVLVAIHLLQRRSVRMDVSTMFLLERVAPEASRGRTIDRLKSSLPLWLQIAAIAMLTWMLIEPRYVDDRSVQRVVVVVDSSASMSAFMPLAVARADEITRRLERGASETEWILLDSDVRRGTLYSGTSRIEMIDRLGDFAPRATGHDPEPALAVARNLAQGRGAVLFVTDHHVEPNGTAILAVGSPIENVGFTGAVVTESGEWSVMVKNHGRAPAARTLSVQGSAPSRIEIEPGHVATLSGVLPSDADHATFRLDPDAFPIDDSAPLVRPKAKGLRVYADPACQALEVVQRVIGGLRSVRVVTDPAEADLEIRSIDAPSTSRPSIRLLFDDAPSDQNVVEPVVAERSAVAAGLSWQGLLRKGTRKIELPEGASPILWQGDQAIAFIADRSLTLAFDLRHSNADRIAATPILLLRFIESVRSARRETEARNVETNEALRLPVEGSDDPIVVRGEQSSGEQIAVHEAASLAAPAEPGFFFVQQGSVLLLFGGARFGDLGEADFSASASETPNLEGAAKLAIHNSHPDPLRPLWILAACACVLFAWRFGDSQAEPAASRRRAKAGGPALPDRDPMDRAGVS